MTRRPWFLCLAAGTGALLLAVVFLATVRVRSAASRLPERGTAVETLVGLNAEVEVALDGRGVPHLRGLVEEDVWLAMGYVHARDRFLQMELARRRAAGRLAEVFGEQALASDRRMRTLRVAATARRQAAQLGDDDVAVLRAYSAGVNAALDSFGPWVAPEVGLLGLPVEPWQTEDSLAICVMMQLDLSRAMAEELGRAVELASLGRERAVDLWGWTPQEARQWLPPVEYATVPAQPEDAISSPGQGGGGNGWALAPGRTASGRPLLANDVHLGVGLPNTWYAIHLQAPGLHVAGVSLPGMPGVMIGHTEGVAWGLTSAGLDDQDLFVLTVDASRGRELIDRTWQPLRTVTERIDVLGREAPELLKVRLSERGPVVRENNREVLALAWTGLSGPSPVTAFLRLDRAASVADVAAAWPGVVGPAMNLVAADTSGHVLHRVVGLVPERPRGAGRLPSPGSDSRWAWRGFLPLATNPHRLDPEDGAVVIADHDVFAEGDYPHLERFPGEFAPPWRVRRIRAALAAGDDWDVSRSLDLQSDVVSGRARALLQILAPVLQQHGGPTARALTQWDGRMDPDALGPLLYSRLLLELAQAIGGDDSVGVGLDATPFRAAEVLRSLAGGIVDDWGDRVDTSEREDRDTILNRVLDRLDEERLAEPWGAVHTVRFTHPMAEVPLLGAAMDRLWSRGPFAAGGGETTINAGYWSERDPFAVVAAPAMRFVADVGDWDQSVLLLPVGQSGRPWSVHYADQIQLWRRNEAASLPFTREAVERDTRALLRLIPAG